MAALSFWFSDEPTQVRIKLVSQWEDTIPVWLRKAEERGEFVGKWKSNAAALLLREWRDERKVGAPATSNA